jgi:uncharacterized tellurite resistance protein B-like protein
MLDRIFAFFESTEVQPDALSVDDSAAVLLIEVMMADHDLDQRERECIAQILSRRMDEPAVEIDRCIDIAMKRRQESHDLFQFTTVINSQYNEDERFQLLVDLWKVAFADGRLDKYEDHRIRRVSELLHLHHSHFIRAKSVAQSD